MPTLEQLVRERTSRLNRAPEALVSSVEKIQRGLLQDVLALLTDLQREGDTIVRSAENLTKAAQITEALKSVLTGKDYLTALTRFANEFDATKVANDKIFDKAFPDFTTSELADLTLANSKAAAIEALAGATATTNFLRPLQGAIEQAVTSGANWRDTLQILSRLTVGDAEYQGKLAQHAKQVAWDALAVADRTYADNVAQDLGAEWFLYAGTEIATTREFCRDRVGKYYTRPMIEAWAELDWSGKMAETTNANTIFQNLGGWNCRHVLVPVSAAVVPEWLRAKAEGRTTGQSSVARAGG